MTVTPLVFDEAGARYYETGVSKGIFFPIDGSPGVPWNGLVSVSQDVSGGALESSYFDGVKYKDKVLAEEFQATVTAVSTPPEFKRCEGVREYAPGVNTSFNKRDKFHMAWRTEIGNDEGTSVGYKIHIAYNCLVQPTARTYQTLADSVSMDSRAFVITTTPACGRHSYFWFDSREYDLTALEAQLYVGVLPLCSDLGALVSEDLDECPSLFAVLDAYNPGELLDEDLPGVDNEVFIYGLVNNGMDVTTLPAAGAFAANDSAASVVGTGNVLADDNDATYITSADGDLGYTVGLPSLVGYVTGCTFELHIRMSINGDVNPDDPDNIDADAQVFITTDAAGDLPVGGFSDGTDAGVGFALSAVDGSIVDYVVPLEMDPWNDLTIDDVVTALEAGAYLNIVGASNNNPATTPVVKVYEAAVYMLDGTDPTKYLRTPSADDAADYELRLYDHGTTTISTMPSVFAVDFKIKRISDDSTGSLLSFIRCPSDTPGLLMFEVDYDSLDYQLAWYFEDPGRSSAPAASVIPKLNTWYTATVEWHWSSIRIHVVERDSSVTLLDHTDVTSGVNPKTHFTAVAGTAQGTSGKTYEVVIDLPKLDALCHESGPVTVDIPVTEIVAAPGAGSKGSDWFDDSLSVEFNASLNGHTHLLMAQWYSYFQSFMEVGKYGTGPNMFNWDLPTGAVIVSMQYVARIYREASLPLQTSDVAYTTFASQYSAPVGHSTYPVFFGKSTGRSGGDDHAFANEEMAVTTSWSDAIEIFIDEPNFDSVLTGDKPFNKFTVLEDDDDGSINVNCEYLAIRVTYML